MVVRRNEVWETFRGRPEDRWPVVDGGGGVFSRSWGAEPGPLVMVCWENSLEAPPPNTIRRGHLITGVTRVHGGGNREEFRSEG